jgi:hypothetical protein
VGQKKNPWVKLSKIIKMKFVQIMVWPLDMYTFESMGRMTAGWLWYPTKLFLEVEITTVNLMTLP